jgi:cyclophilin family peptidyl-prolyl cis-trans isomerase
MPTTPSQPVMQIDTAKQYFAVLKTTKGDITIELNAKGTPITVNNFVSLAQADFYDKTIFHRVMKGFMIQGGDPMGTGRGGPGYRFDDEPFTGEYTRGTVAMANAGPNTNGSQFFIMHADVPLEKNYVIFGRVVSGLDVVDAIASAPVTFANGEKSSPVEPVVVSEVSIETK